MMQARQRTQLRRLHVAVAAFLGGYVYSLAHSDPLWTDIARFIVFPAVGLSGAWMWSQGRIARWRKRLAAARVA